MTPSAFIKKWQAANLKERSAAQEHFIDVCRLLDEPTPAEADPDGAWYCFERGASKLTGSDGWADVWKRGSFSWEYKGKHKDLQAAYVQLQQYSVALENPPLLVVCDMERFRIHTNWTNTVQAIYDFTLDDLHEPDQRQRLKWVFSDPEQLKPGKTRQMLMEEAAEQFASLAQRLRVRGHDPQAVAHFINRLVFCMFAEDIGLLPNAMFSRMFEEAGKHPAEFVELAQDLFRAMQSGGRVGYEHVEWFNGGLFDTDEVLPLDQQDISRVLKAARLDWSDIDPSIFGMLFERGLDPDKRSQLGAHYTDRDKIMMLVEPVVVRPLQVEWEAVKAQIAQEMEKYQKAKAASTEPEASLIEAPFEHVRTHVLPERSKNRCESYRMYWWRHVEPRPALMGKLAQLERYIVTPRVSKYRLFVWCPFPVMPDSATFAFARDDDTSFGILHSRVHEIWALRLGTSLEDRPRYTSSTAFETFPFPEGLTPDIPATKYADDPRAQKIAAAAKRLNDLRDNWLNPPDLIMRVPEVVEGYPDRLLPKNEAAAQGLKQRTLTNLYNERPAWLENAHRNLDEAVADAYGWKADISEDEMLAKLLTLNLERAKEHPR